MPTLRHCTHRAHVHEKHALLLMECLFFGDFNGDVLSVALREVWTVLWKC